MSRASMMAAASALPRAPIYGIGACLVGTEIRDFEIGWDEFERDVDWAASILTASGLKRGDLVLVTSPNWENPWTSPLVHGLRRIGAVYLTAEQFSWDARRVCTFLHNLELTAVIGLGAETLDAMTALTPDVAELLGRVELLWARRDARTGLADLGVDASDFVLFGPALALGIPGQPGAVVNPVEWAISARNGEFHVSTAGQRLTTFQDVATGYYGRVRGPHDLGVAIEFAVANQSDVGPSVRD